MKNQKEYSNKRKKGGKEIRITRVSPMMHDEITNIADHLGVSKTDFLKGELLHIIGKHPEHYRKPFNKD